MSKDEIKKQAAYSKDYSSRNIGTKRIEIAK
jgi:hypothetical protein